MKHILLSCLLLLALCATALAAPVEKQPFRVVAPEGWTVTAVPDVSEGVVLVAPDKSVSVTIVTAASGTMTPEQLAEVPPGAEPTAFWGMVTECGTRRVKLPLTLGGCRIDGRLADFSELGKLMRT